MFVLDLLVEVDVGGHVRIKNLCAYRLFLIGNLEQLNILTHG
jgi:hypothetical protein